MKIDHSRQPTIPKRIMTEYLRHYQDANGEWTLPTFYPPTGEWSVTNLVSNATRTLEGQDA